MNKIRIALLLSAALIAPAAAQSPVIGAVQVIQSAAAEKSHVLKATPGYLLKLRVNIGATAGYVLLYDLTAAPSDGSVTPRWCETVAGNGTLGTATIDFPTPLRFPANGIVALFSTTGCFNQTGSNASFFAQVQ